MKQEGHQRGTGKFPLQVGKTLRKLVLWRKRMGIEPTWERLHAPTPDLKSGSPTSELGASKDRQYIMSRPI